MGGGRWRLARAAAALGRLLFWKVHLFLPLQGVGWGNTGKCGPLVSGYSVIRIGWGGAAEALGGGGCWGDGGEGVCCERAGFESAGAGVGGLGLGRHSQEGSGGSRFQLELVGIFRECMG